MSDEQRIYVACLASYNAGTLHGTWIDATQDIDDVWSEVNAMLRSSPCPNVEVDCPTCDGTGKDSPCDGLATPSDDTCATCKGRGKVPIAEEWAIHDHEGFEGIDIGENESMERVVALAQLVGEHGDAFAAWWANGSHDAQRPDTWAESFRECYRGTYRSIEDYAEEIVGECYSLEDLPPLIAMHIDYAGIARDMECGGEIWTAAGGDGVLVFDNTV